MPQIIRRPLTLTAPGQQLELTQFVYNKVGPRWSIFKPASMRTNTRMRRWNSSEWAGCLEDQLMGESACPHCEPGG